MRRRGLAIQYVAIGSAESTQEHWLFRGSLLERSYRTLVREAKQGDRRFRQISGPTSGPGEIVGRDKISWAIVFERSQLLIPAAMLAGMSIECYFKALAVANGNAPTIHDLRKLAVLAGYSASPSELDLLSRLTEMNQLGRYHRTSKGNANFDISSSEIDAILEVVTSHVRSHLTP